MCLQTPSYSLESIKTLIREGNSHITGTALFDASLYDLTDVHIKDVVLLLSPGDFYKSMQSEKNELIWQDVYHKVYCGITWYIKVQIRGRAIVISFKESDKYKN